MLTAQQIAEQASSMIDEDIDPVQDLDFILQVVNDFALEVNNDFPKIATQEFIVDNTNVNTWINVPSTCLALATDSDGNYILTKDGADYKGTFYYRTLNQLRQIKFPVTGTFQVYFEVMPTSITAVASPPDTHEYLHPICVYYMASRYKSMDDDENPDAARLMQEYFRRRTMALRRLDGSTNGGYSVIRYREAYSRPTGPLDL